MSSNDGNLGQRKCPSAHVYVGNILMLSEGKFGVDNVYTLREGKACQSLRGLIWSD